MTKEMRNKVVLEKTFACSIENIDEVFVEIAKEISNGWHVASWNSLDIRFSDRVTMHEPSFEIKLIKRRCV